jgi:uncharacterized protein (DUF885 family)
MSEALDRLVDRYLTVMVRDYPVFATFLGMHEHDAELGTFTPDAMEGKHRRRQELLSELEGIEPAKEETDAAIDRAVLRAALKRGIFEYEVLRTHERAPSTYIGEALGGCNSLITKEFAPIEERALSLLGRVRAVPDVLRAIDQNCCDVPGVFATVGSQMAGGGVAFMKSVVPAVAESVPELKAELLAAADQAAAAFDETALSLAAMAEGATAPFAIGQTSYDWLLRESHLLDFDGRELLEMGRGMMADTKQRIEDLATEIDPDASWHAVMEELKADHPSKEGLKARYLSEMKRARDFVIENGLVTIPDGEELDVIDTPVFIRGIIPYAAYMPPGPFEERQLGLFYVTPVDESLPHDEQERQLRGHSVHTIPIVALHEGYPGHHLQLVRANACERKVRRLTWNTVFVEGWALYCEEMMKDVGFCPDKRTRLGQLKETLWRAARIVVDTGLQTGRMSVDEGIEFMMTEVALERVNATAEVRRYASYPTQPSSYMIGKRAIMSIRERYESSAGSSFNLREFHDTLLDLGSLQPKLVEIALGMRSVDEIT